MNDKQLEKNAKYWQERAEQRLMSAEQKTLRLETELKKQFDRAYKNIEEKIARLYFKYSSETGLDYADVVKYLTDIERKEFQKNLSFYIEGSKSNNFEKPFREYLLALSTKARVQRLEALKTSIEYEVHELYEKQMKLNTQITFDDILKENYYKTIFDFQQFKGIGTSFNRVSPNLLESLLEFPWSGKNYSQKIWGHVNSLSDKLENVLTSGIIQGKSNQEMAAELQKATDAAYKNAVRLIRTETNYIAGEATQKAYEEFGLERYQFLATLDLKTSEICRSLDRKVFLVKERKAGVNCNPMHPHCRSTTIPYIPDLEGTRVARGSDEKTYKVDRNMSYPEWYEKYVASDPHELQAEKIIKKESSDKKQYTKYKEVLGKDAPKSFDKFKELKYNSISGWDDLKTQYRTKNYIRSDRQVKEIDKGQQNKHIAGTNEYKQYVDKLKNIGQYGPSKITIGQDEIKNLINQYSGTGTINIKNGKWDKKETILDNDKIIGNAVNNLTGKQADTTVFKIHYRGKGVHIVPDYPSKKKVKK